MVYTDKKNLIDPHECLNTRALNRGFSKKCGAPPNAAWAILHEGSLGPCYKKQITLDEWRGVIERNERLCSTAPKTITSECILSNTIMTKIPTFPPVGPTPATRAQIMSHHSSRSARGQLPLKASILISLRRTTKMSLMGTYKHFPGILFDTSPPGP